MAAKNVQQLLVDIAKKGDAGELASFFAYYYPQLKEVPNDKSKLFEQIVTYLNLVVDINVDTILTQEVEETEDDIFENKDFRIQSIQLSSVRGIPDAIQNIPYGIDFMHEGLINNAIILANNGVGKSSVFAAIEMIYAQEIGEKQLRNNTKPNEDEYKKYLKRFDSLEQPYCNVLTPSGSYSLSTPIFSNYVELRKYNPANHFISDYDIYNYGKVDFDGAEDNSNSFHNLIARSLGLSDFMLFQNQLRELSSYRRLKENQAWSRSLEKKKELERSIKNLNAEIQQKQELLRQQIDASSPESKSKEDQKFIELEPLLNKSLEQQKLSSNIKEIKKEFRTAYSKMDISSKATLKSRTQSFLNIGKELLHESDDCPLCQNSKSTIQEIRTLLEQRLAHLAEAEIVEQEVSSKYKILMQHIADVFTSLFALSNQIDAERSVLEKNPGLSELLQQEIAFIAKYDPLLVDEEMYSYLSTMSKKFTPMQEDYESLLRFIDGPVITDIDILVDDLNNLIDTRLSKLQSYIKNETSKPSTPNVIPVLEEDIKRFKTQIATKQAEIDELGPEIERLSKLKDQVSFIKEQVNVFLPFFEVEISKLVKDSFKPIRSMVESIMNNYLKDSGLELKIEILTQTIKIEEDDLRRDTIVANIVKVANGETITPDLYFNTFRYKLFTLMISLSLALATRAKYNINLPLVLDDLFAGSDFVSKNSFSEFLSKLIGLFYEHTPHLPLQFILFTHDDVIFRSALDALDNFHIEVEEEELDEENKIPLFEKTKIGRIFKIEEGELEITKNTSTPFKEIVYYMPNKILID